MGELKLISCKNNVTYKIKKICLEDGDILRLLSHLGISINENITLLSSNYGKKSFLVNVQGTNFALDQKICSGIIVE